MKRFSCELRTNCLHKILTETEFMILHDLDQTGAIAIVMCHYFHGNICSGNLGKKVY